MSIPRVRVTIDALVLSGFAAEHRKALAAGLQAELERLLSDPEKFSLLGDSRWISHYPARKLEVAGAASPRKIGSQAARHVTQMVRS